MERAARGTGSIETSPENNGQRAGNVQPETTGGRAKNPLDNREAPGLRRRRTTTPGRTDEHTTHATIPYTSYISNHITHISRYITFVPYHNQLTPKSHPQTVITSHPLYDVTSYIDQMTNFITGHIAHPNHTNTTYTNIAYTTHTTVTSQSHHIYHPVSRQVTFIERYIILLHHYVHMTPISRNITLISYHISIV